MQCLIINLQENAERWRRMQEQTDRLGLPASRLEAVAGARLSPAECQRLYSPELNRRQFHRPLVPGEIGCYASHREAWRRLLASNEPMFAVFEDDVLLSLRLPRMLEAVARLPAGWDMVKLTGRAHEQVLRSHAIASAGGSQLVTYRRVPSLTGAYVISRAGTQKLLRHRTPFGRPVDVDLRHWWECELRVFGLLPYPVRQDMASATSTIRGRQPVERTFARRLKKLGLQLQYTALNWGALHWSWLPASGRAALGDAPDLGRLFRER